MRIRRVVTTRAGGRSKPPYESFNLGAGVGDDPAAVAANRHRLADELGLGRDRLVWMEQVHGRNAEVVDGPRAAAVETTDALVTAEPGLALVALCADCVPVLLADPEANVVGAAHAGRVGARVGVLPAALKAMEQAGASIDRIEVLLGSGRVRRVLRGPGRHAGRRREAPARHRRPRPAPAPRASTSAPASGASSPTRAWPRSASTRGARWRTKHCSVTAGKGPLGDWPL